MLSKVLILDILSCTRIKYRARERKRKRESERQASEAQREKERQGFKARDKQQSIILLEEQHENFVGAVTKMTNASGQQCKVKMSGSEKK